MPVERSRLEKAFLQDHRSMMRGLHELREAVEQRRWPEAESLARAVDEVAGPHIRFEEEAFYPLLKEPLGDLAVRQLYAEHQEARDAVALVRSRRGEALTEAERSTVLGALTVGLQHAVTCGTLLSHLHGLSGDEERALWRRHQACVGQPTDWSRLPRHPDAT